MVLGHCADRFIPVVVTMGGGYGQPLSDTVTVHVNTVREVQRVFG